MTANNEQPLLALESECPGYDKCPVAMCGCRWLGEGSPWVEGGGDIEQRKAQERRAA